MISGPVMALVEPAFAQEMMAALDRAASVGYGDAKSRPYDVQGPIAIIGVNGVLIDKCDWASSWATGYDYIRRALGEAFEDPSVQGIVLDVDSYGGLVSGCFDLCDWIFEAKQQAQKPIAAILSECAYSAAYAIASCADQIAVPRTGGVGSIGVVTMHVDYSGWLAQEGMKVTLIKAGAHKTDGNPYEPLPDDVKAEITAELEAVRTLFAETVSRNRTSAGVKLDVAAVLATEARTYDGLEGTKQAVSIGLADAVASPDEAFAAFQAFVEGKTP